MRYPVEKVEEKAGVDYTQKIGKGGNDSEIK